MSLVAGDEGTIRKGLRRGGKAFLLSDGRQFVALPDGAVEFSGMGVLGQMKETRRSPI